MAAPKPSGQSNEKDIHAFLSSLDDLAAHSSAGSVPGSTATAHTPSSGPPTEEAQSVLDFLDEITQRSSTPAAPVPKRATPLPRQNSSTSVRSASALPRASTESTGSGKGVNASIPPASRPETPANTVKPVEQTSPGGWGWSSVWTSASSVIQQARNVAEENIKHLPQAPPVATESAQKWKQGVMDLVTKGVDVEKLRRELQESAGRTLTDILNAVAPPIAEHEVIQVALSHDMAGYDGVETLVYRALAKIMEQVEGGDLVVNRGNEEKPSATTDAERNLNAVEGLEEAYKLAEADLDSLVKKIYQPTPPPDDVADEKGHARSPSKPNSAVPITYCQVFMRIQPCLAPLPFYSTSSLSTTPDADKQKHLFFMLLMRDPKHNIVHRTLTQALPGSWLDIPFEENEWVEDNMVDIIRKGVETVGQAYVMSRQAGAMPSPALADQKTPMPAPAAPLPAESDAPAS